MRSMRELYFTEDLSVSYTIYLRDEEFYEVLTKGELPGGPIVAAVAIGKLLYFPHDTTKWRIKDAIHPETVREVRDNGQSGREASGGLEETLQKGRPEEKILETIDRLLP